MISGLSKIFQKILVLMDFNRACDILKSLCYHRKTILIFLSRPVDISLFITQMLIFHSEMIRWHKKTEGAR